MARNKAPATAESLSDIHFLSDEEAWAILDKQARRYLKMSAEEFVEAWEQGRFGPDPDRPEVMRVAFLLPLVGKQ